MATKITLRPKGATDDSLDVVLADGADRADDNVRGPADAEVSVAIAMQQHNGIRADSARFYSRANRSGSYSFQASRRFASLEDAGRFILTHGHDCPAEGTLIVDFGDSAATPPGNLVLLHGACIRQIGPMRQTGVHIATGYQTNYSLAAEVAADAIDVAIAAFDDAKLIRKINCGADVDANGWLKDAGYTGGTNYHNADAAITNAGSVPLDVYRRYRAAMNTSNAFSYSIALPAADYDVKLHLCAHGTVEYIMNVAIGGSTVVSGLNVVTEAGGYLKALVKTYSVTHPGGYMNITFTPASSGKAAVICGIELVET